MNGNQHVLIVDDTGSLRYQELFNSDHFVQTATDLASALDIVRAQPSITIALVNLENATEDAFTLLAELHCLQEPPAVGLCLASTEVERYPALGDLGVDELMIRPLHFAALKHHIAVLQQLRKHREDAKRNEKTHLNLLNKLSTGAGFFGFTGKGLKPLFLNNVLLSAAQSADVPLQPDMPDALALLNAEDASAVLNGVVRNLHSGDPVDLPIRIIRKDGSELSLRLRALPVRCAQIDMPVYLANFTDITAQYHAERALKDADRQMLSLMNTVPGGIAIYSLTPKIQLLYSNDVLRRMCGYTAEEYDRIMQEDYHLLIDPRDHALVDSTIASFIEEPRHLEDYFRILSKNGDVLWMRATLSPHADGKHCNTVFIDVTREKENEEKTERMLREMYFHAEHDALTGIHNREAFYRKTAELLRDHPEQPYVLLAMDIERFKVINDLFGKDLGDRILKAIANGLQHLLSAVGTYARLEADHFVACFPQKLLDIDRIAKLFAIGLRRQKIDYQIQLCFGIYLIHNRSVPINHMCDRAVMALKTVKGNAVTHFAYYSDKMRLAMLEETAILDEMNAALQNGQFVPYLQPIFSVETGRPVSVEALVRWNHPSKGLIPPARFIPLFEQNGFIIRLDYAIWEQACQVLADWKRRGYPLPLSVNMSRIDLYHPHICDDLIALTRKYDIDPSSLRLEITESAYSKDPNELLTAIDRLRSEGFVVLMDDFGSGYSSLNILMDMPVDVLKLDMRFLATLNTNPRAASVLTSVVRMAKWLHIPVVAEGVETQEQLAFLRSIGCDNAQGYLFAMPMSVAEYTLRYVEPSDKAPMCLPTMTQDSLDLSCLWNGDKLTDALFNGMVGGMGIYELNNRHLEIRRVNDGFCELFGCSPQDVFDRGNDALVYLHPDDRQGLLEVCRTAAQTAHVERYVGRHVHMRDGRQIWVEARVRHLGRAGASDVFCFTFHDVTDRKEFEQVRDLRNYALLLRGIYTSVFEINLKAQTVRTVCSPSGDKLAAQPEQPTAALANMLQELLFEPDLELCQSVFSPGYLSRRMRDEQRDYYLVERKTHAAGKEPRWASFTFLRMPTDTQEETYLLCIADVDTRKRTDDLLLENQWLQQKQAEQEQYLALMEHLGTTLFEINTRTGRVVSSFGFRHYALSAFDFHQLHSYKDLEPFLFQQDLPLFRMFVNDLLAHGSAAVTLRVMLQSGQSVWCRVLSSLISDEAGHLARCVTAISQIDEEVKIREQYLDEQSRFQTFADNFQVGLGIFEVSQGRQRILYLSGGYRHMTGYTDGEAFYDDRTRYAGVHPDDIPRLNKPPRLC